MGKRYLSLCVALSMPLLMGMGVLGGNTPRSKVPETPKQFDATITDVDGTSTRLEQLSYDGELYVPAYRGKALVIIPFEKIAAIEFGEKAGGKRKALVTMVNQKSETLLIEDNVLFVGKVPYGTYQIETKDIKTLQIQAPTHPQ